MTSPTNGELTTYIHRNNRNFTDPRQSDLVKTFVREKGVSINSDQLRKQTGYIQKKYSQCGRNYRKLVAKEACFLKKKILSENVPQKTEGTWFGLVERVKDASHGSDMRSGAHCTNTWIATNSQYTLHLPRTQTHLTSNGRRIPMHCTSIESHSPFFSHSPCTSHLVDASAQTPLKRSAWKKFVDKKGMRKTKKR